MYHLALKCYKIRLLRCILFKKTKVPRVSLFFTLFATANTVHGVILRACKCIKSETRKPAIFRLKIAGSIARGSSPYQATWMIRRVLNLVLEYL